MRDRWLVDRARDRLIVTQALMLKLHDKLRFGRAPREPAELASAVILAQIEQAIAAVEEASRSLRAGPPGETVAPAAAAHPSAAQEALVAMAL